MTPTFSLLKAASAAIALLLLAMTMTASIWQVAPLTRTLPPSFDLYSPAYDAVDIRAPTAVSLKLRLFARILVSSPLGDYLARALLVRNGVARLVDFAEEIQRRDEPLLEDKADDEEDRQDRPNGGERIVGEPPMIRLSSSELAWHEAAASAEPLAAAERLEKHEKNSNGATCRSTTGTCDSSNREESSSSSSKHRYNSIHDYHRAYERNSTDPTRVITRLLKFIDETDAALRCVESRDADGAVRAARASTERWGRGEPLGLWDGVPVMVKPEFMVRGLPYTSGRQFRGDGRSDLAPRDDVVVSRLREAGAIVVGYAAMHELGVQPTGYNPWRGGPNNPHGLDRFPGGSSSGSAVAVATGMVPVALGQDGGGSVRIPAAWSGAVGLAAGYARIPFRKDKENIFTVAKAGVLAATVGDSLEALLLLGEGVSDEEEGADRHAYRVSYGGDGLPPPHSRPRWAEESVERPIRLGVYWDWVGHRPPSDYAGKDDAVYNSFVDVVRSLEENGDASGRKFEVINITIPHLHTQALVHGILITSMFSFAQMGELYRKTNRRESPETDDDLQPATEVQIKLGSQITALELLACYRIRNWALSQWRHILEEEVDVILTPTTPMTALVRPPGSDEIGLSDTGLFVQMMRFIWPGNLIGLPGLAVPIGVDSDGLPLSIQVLCAHWHEADCLSVGGTIEDLRYDSKPMPPEGLFVDLLRQD